VTAKGCSKSISGQVCLLFDALNVNNIMGESENFKGPVYIFVTLTR